MHLQDFARNSNGNAPQRAPDSCEPIAIVGMACRLPGEANSPEEYWQLLEHGRDAIQEIPPDRWDWRHLYDPVARPGKTQSRWAGLVSDIDLFDPQLFGISPREASRMDPQQRLLLEVAWRALEDAGQPFAGLAGKPVSVFVGISSWDYAFAGLCLDDRGVIDAYSNTGGSFSIAANRISYCFDLRGPSVAVDTACSSSLVAVHLACESLWQGHAELALAGGANALLMPDFFVAFSQLGVLSPDGRCKAFDAGANGYVRSEGAGMVVLKPLSAAIRHHDRIYAVIRGTAVNQDGRTPGLTVPNPEAQQLLVQQACQRAGIQPREIQYVEAHGTGTPVGDPVEARALASVLSDGRKPDDACWIGSVKTNIGHLESGAGIASVIKVALALHHRRLPAHLHFQAAHPDIDLQRFGLRIPTSSRDWPDNGAPRTAGINGFGYGGANAHLILQQAPAPPQEDAPLPVATNGYDQVPTPQVLALSARSHSALLQRVRDWQTWLPDSGSSHSLESLAATAAHRHSHWEHRLAVCGSCHDEWLAELESQHRQLNAASHAESRHAVEPGIVFACCGQGPQWWGMGRELLQYSTIFRETIEACDAEIVRLGSWSLMDELRRDERRSRLQKTSIAQPALFAIQVGLAAIWKSCGTTPAALVGHSVGEIAAGYLSGALSWQDACCVAFHRGRTMDRVTSSGSMLAVGLSVREVGPWLRETDGQVVVSAINGPHSLTLSGSADEIHRLGIQIRAQGVFCRQLQVEYAFHSPQMEPVRDELLQCLHHISPTAAAIPMYSTVTGRRLNDERLDAEYWWHNVRQTVRFADSVTRMAREPWQVFVELGPHPVLAYAINECYGAVGKQVWTVASLHREIEDRRALQLAIGQLYELGQAIDWHGVVPPPAVLIPIPGHPFEKQRCWSESRSARLSRTSTAEHPLVGESLHGPVPAWHGRVDLRVQSYLQDHCVRKLCVIPAAAMLDGGLWVARQLFASSQVRLEDFRLHEPCVLAVDRPKWLQYTYEPQRQQLQIHFREVAEDTWSPLATMNLASAQDDLERPLADLAEVRARCTMPVRADDCYSFCERIGLEYGPRFRGLSGGWRRSGEALVHVNLPASLEPECSRHEVHPALLDSCFHAMVVADPSYENRSGQLHLPSQIRELRCYRTPADHLLVHVQIQTKSARRLLANLDVYGESGELVLSIRGFESLRIHHQRDATELKELIYSYGWEPSAADTTATTEASHGRAEREAVEATPVERHWLIFADQHGLGTALASHAATTGDTVRLFSRQDFASALDPRPSRASAPSAQVAKLLHDELSDVSPAKLRIVYLFGLDAPPNTAINDNDLDPLVSWQTLALLSLVQAWEQIEPHQHAEMFVVTAAAQAHQDRFEDISLAQSVLIGLGRVIVSEYAAWRTRLIDLPPSSCAATEQLVNSVAPRPGYHPDLAKRPQVFPSNDNAASQVGPDAASLEDPSTSLRLSQDDNTKPTLREQGLEILLQELSLHDDEDEVMWRDGQRYVHRFRPHFGKPQSKQLAATCAYRLPIDPSFSIEQLRYVAHSPAALAADEVEIKVAAAGLNFSDVMKALGLYPGKRDEDEYLGAECSGTISRLGADVQGWQVGERVIAVAPGSFGSHVVVPVSLVARLPQGLSLAEAAGVPIAFLTAAYALHECARLRSGETVLVHAATGGVGMAALQLVRQAGARALASAGTAEKRRLARQLGAEAVVPSRGLSFADQVLRATAGAGVDVILNSLAGTAIPRGLSILKPGGRFLEIGKRDIYADASLGMGLFRNNNSLFGIDLDQLFQLQPEPMGRLLAFIAEQLEQGQLHALMTTVFPAHQTREAFRWMQQGKHVGKVILDYATPPAEIYPGSQQPELELSSDATYWIIGGLGGFGLEVAKWLVRCGARSLVLTNRRAASSEKALHTLDQLREEGVDVHVMPADVTSMEDVRRVLARISSQLRPLRGVFHAAMILEDRLLVDLDEDTLRRVLRPKVLGGWNLHQATRNLALDHFVLFSSLSSVFGHAGQANYAAANAFLDSLARYRRSQGLPGLAMNWGHLGGVGYLAERSALNERLERQGVLSFTVEQATECLSYAMVAEEAQLSVLRMDWSLWRGLGITTRVSPRFAHLLRHGAQPPKTDDDEPMSMDQLRQAGQEACRQHFERQLRLKISQLLGIPVERLDAAAPLLNLGLDSLMAVEMRNWIQSRFELNVPIAALMRSASLGSLAEQMTDGLFSTEGWSQRDTGESADDGVVTRLTLEQAYALLDEIDAFSETEVDYWLERLVATAKDVAHDY